MEHHPKFQYRFLWVFFLFLLMMVSAVQAGMKPNSENYVTGADYNSAELLQSIENAVFSETNSLKELKGWLGNLETIKKAVIIELNAYKIQNSAHSNLLLHPATSIKDLAKALNDNLQTLNTIDKKIKDFIKQRDSVQELRQQTRDHIDLYTKQESEIKNSRWPKSEKSPLAKALNTLIRIMTEKQSVLQKLQEDLSTIVSHLEEVRVSAHQLSRKFEQQIERRTTQELFARRYIMLKVFSGDVIAAEFSSLLANLGKLYIVFLLSALF